MKVYNSSSLHSSFGKSKKEHGIAQKVNWVFEYLGVKRSIPVVYHSKDSIVFDLITLLDENQLRVFFEKYQDIEEDLTDIQRQCAEQEHPFQSVEIGEIWIEGKKNEHGFSSSSAVSLPFTGQKDSLGAIRQAYSNIVGNSACFACERFRVPYVKTMSRWEKFLSIFGIQTLHTIKIVTHPKHYIYPLDACFSLSEQNREYETRFVHPVTGVKHTLYFELGEGMVIPQPLDAEQSFYSASALYEVSPALPEGDRLQFDSSMSYTCTQNDGFSPTGTASIGIIGGACGPTAIFIAGKGNEEVCGAHGLPMNTCFSVVTQQKEEISQFCIKAISTRHHEAQEYFLKNRKL